VNHYLQTPPMAGKNILITGSTIYVDGGAHIMN
jgi:enoyl-[acyl-carrier-protein] reductase (NADH)